MNAPRYQVGQVFTPTSESGNPIPGLTGDYPIIEVGENHNGHYWYRLDTGDSSIPGWTREDCLLTRKEFNRLVGGDQFTIFLRQFDLSPNGKTAYTLPVKCPVCDSGALTAWAGNKGGVNVQCSNGCHAVDMGRGMGVILDRLNNQKARAALPTVQIAVNRKYDSKIAKDAQLSVWNRFNGTFKTESLDLAGLAAVIQAGHAITAVHKSYRKKDNFISAQHLGLDFDTEDARSSLDTLQADEFISKYGALLYTTASHTPQKPRARVLFILEQPITDPEQYRRAALALIARYGMVDEHCKDAARVWFGAKGCEVRVLGNLLPSQVLENLMRAQSTRQARAGAPTAGKVIPNGARNGTLASLAGSMRKRGLEEPEINAALQKINARRCDPPLPETDVERIAKSIGGYDSPPLTQVETPPDPAQLLETARNASAVDRPAALRTLAEALHDSDLFTVTHYAQQVKAAGLCTQTEFIQAVKESQKRQGAAQTQAKIPTDDELGARWLVQYPDTAFGLGEFRRYTAGVWEALPLDTAKAELTQVIESAKLEGLRPTLSRLQSALELARVKVSIPNERWDSDLDLLPCKNGALHIPTRSLRAHAPGHYFTSGLPYDYEPSARCPEFERALESSVPESMDFIQEFAGYALTVDTRYEIALWLYGERGSGKSTILSGLQAMLGARAGILGLADIERSRFALSNIPGKTLLISTEQPARFFQATHVLNAIISGETIELDRKFRDPIILTPRAKVAWAMNELPRLEAAGDGLFRRVKVVEFPPRAEADRDPQVKETIQGEAAGILNWALIGLERLRQRGSFEIPRTVKEATERFQVSNDIPAAFVDECCIRDVNDRTQGSILYASYKAWCLATGHKAQSSTSVADDWRRLGFKKVKADVSYWHGVKVKNPIFPMDTSS